MYASNDLIMEYEDYKSTTANFGDGDKEFFLDDRIMICNVFIAQYIEISKKLKTLSGHRGQSPGSLTR